MVLSLIPSKPADSNLILRDTPGCYKYAAKRFVDFLGERGYDFSYPGLIAFLNNIEGIQTEGPFVGRVYSASTYNHYADAAVNRIRYALDHAEGKMTVAEKYEIQQALKEIKRKKRDKGTVSKDMVLSVREIKKLMAGSPAYLSLMIEMLAYTALRISELLGILNSDIKKRGDYYVIRIRGKGGKERKVGISVDLGDRIKEHFQGKSYLFEHHGKPYRREYISMSIKRYGRKILNREISAHTLRHTWATIAIKKTGRVKAVQEQLGHSSSSTTLNLYVHDSFSLDEQKDILK